MKKIIFVFCALIFGFLLKAQNFLGNDAYLYINATVKPAEFNENSQKFHYENFYLQFDTISKIITKEPIGKKKEDFKPFQTGESYSWISDYTKLVGIEFKVIGVYEEATKFEFEKGRYFVLALSNETIGTIYYEYDSRYKHNFELTVVGSISFPEGYWCEKFTIIKDKFDNKTSYYSPQESGFTVVKIEQNGNTTFYLSVEETGSTANIDGAGLYLLFNDGTKLSKEDAVIGLKAGENGNYIYSAFVELTTEDLEILRNKKITDNRLYIYDGTVSDESASIIQKYIQCVLN